MEKSPHEIYYEEITKDGREPTRKEMQMLGNMIWKDWWFSKKEKIKRIFRCK